VKKTWLAGGAAIATLLAGLTAAAPAQATTAAGPCVMDIDYITAGGNITGTRATATTPPTASAPGAGVHLFGAGAAKASTTWFNTMGVAGGMTYNGYVILGTSLYSGSYGVEDGTGKPFQNLTRVGGGWGNFTSIEQSIYQPYVGGPLKRAELYGLRSDGVLLRWNGLSSAGWRADGSYPGFSAVKTMALISQTDTYDTFLANTRSGALYTIRIPAASPMKPIVTVVRSSSWSGFDSLVAEKCGTQSTLLAAVDKETSTATLYAVGHATGGTINFLDSPDTAEHLYGE
jgi:hypothetical protein